MSKASFYPITPRVQKLYDYLAEKLIESFFERRVGNNGLPYYVVRLRMIPQGAYADLIYPEAERLAQDNGLMLGGGPTCICNGIVTSADWVIIPA